jgi:hypothetical protein
MDDSLRSTRSAAIAASPWRKGPLVAAVFGLILLTTPAMQASFVLIALSVANRGQATGTWVDLTRAQITSSLQALWRAADTTARFPVPAMTRAAPERLWHPVLAR